MTTLTLDWKIFILALVLIFWMMKNEKIKVILGETRKLLQILPLSKIAEAVIVYCKSKGKINPEP